MRYVAMPDGEERDVVRAQIRARMAELGWSATRLAEEASVSTSTVTEFLNGSRGWPRAGTLQAVEKALGWPPGTMAKIAEGQTPDELGRLHSAHDTSRTATGSRMVLTWDVDVTDGMSPAELAEARAAAEQTVLRLLREMRAQHGPS